MRELSAPVPLWRAPLRRARAGHPPRRVTSAARRSSEARRRRPSSSLRGCSGRPPARPGFPAPQPHPPASPPGPPAPPDSPPGPARSARPGPHRPARPARPAGPAASDVHRCCRPGPGYNINVPATSPGQHQMTTVAVRSAPPAATRGHRCCRRPGPGQTRRGLCLVASPAPHGDVRGPLRRAGAWVWSLGGECRGGNMLVDWVRSTSFKARPVRRGRGSFDGWANSAACFRDQFRCRGRR